MSFAFSAPYLYTSLTFGGDKQYIDCIVPFWKGETKLDDDTTCMAVRICVQDDSYYNETVSRTFPGGFVITSKDEVAFYSQYKGGDCNVIAGDQFQVSQKVTFNNVQKTDVYNYTTTVDMLSMKSEPVSIVTSKDDITWSDFVNWVVNGLLFSEQMGYTRAETLKSYYLEWNAFGDEYKKSFFFTNEVVGSSREIYERNLEPYVPRQKINTVNNGTLGGVIYSTSFGNLTRMYGPEPIQNSTLDIIQTRKYLNCGVRYETVFAQKTPLADGVSYNYSGFDVDYCRALSAAIFNDTNHVNYTDLSNSDRFIALKDKRVDVLSRITTITLVRDVSLTFSQPTFFDNIFFAGHKE
jgi:ABC-type amino acid transport substrate-binding protein